VIVAVGAPVSTTQVAEAGLPVFPAWSVARTRKVWLPSARPLYALGLAHALKLPPSRLHWKTLPLSSLEKLRLALVAFVGLCGGAMIVVVGATVSTVNVVAELRPRLPAASSCSARAVYVPSGRLAAATEYAEPLRVVVRV
jgi:hypothetical protein